MPARTRTAKDRLLLPKPYIPTEAELPGSTLTIVDRLIPPQTIAGFISFMVSGALPDGTRTNLPLVPPEEMVDYIREPYSTWAPPPYNQIHDNIGDRMMILVASNETGDNICVVDKDLHAMKSRLWEGIVPLSDSRWIQKNLDDPGNHDLACQHLSAVVDVFTYFNKPSVLYRLRAIFNAISVELTSFESAINAIRSTRSEQPVSITALWLEYMTALYLNMTTRSHSWIISHITVLRQRLKTELLSIENTADPDYESVRKLPDLESQRREFERIHLGAYTAEQLNNGNKFQDLADIAARADYTILMPLDGYIGYTSTKSSPMDSLANRGPLYMQNMRLKSRSIMAAQMMDSGFAIPRLPSQDSREIAKTGDIQVRVEEQLRLETRGAVPQLGPVWWIGNSSHKMEQIESWGFVAYRLSYSETPEEWARFKKKLFDDSSRWADGIAGADRIKAGSTIKWMDGKELGIAEGDIAAAKEHFLSFRKTDSKTWEMIEGVFLAADAECITSYLDPQPISAGQSRGDFGGYVLAVDVEFDPKDPASRIDETPGYPSQMKILGSLIYGDLYALMSAQAQWPEDMWPLASAHPNQVYVGPVVEKERLAWKTMPGFVQYTA